MKRARVALVTCIAVALECTSGLTSDEVIPSGSQRLAKLIRDASVIAVVEFRSSKARPDESGQLDLHFRLVRALSGAVQGESVTVPAFAKSHRYRTLHGAKSALLFLKQGKDGTLVLADNHSYFRLEGSNASLAEELEQYLALRRSYHIDAAARQEFRAFLINKVATSKSEYFKENMAEDVWEMIAGVRQSEFTEKDVDAMAGCALSEKAYSVLEPLCLALVKLGSKKAGVCIMHAVLDAAPSDRASRLTRIIAERDDLVGSIMERLEGVEDQQCIFRVLFRQLSGVADATLLPRLRLLWRRNSAARPVIKDFLSRQAVPERSALLRELEAPAPAREGEKGQHSEAPSDPVSSRTPSEESGTALGQAGAASTPGGKELGWFGPAIAAAGLLVVIGASIFVLRRRRTRSS